MSESLLSENKEPDLKSRIKSLLSADKMANLFHKQQAWFTPWQWVDSGRVYCGDSGFWLYAALPVSCLFESNKGLIATLNDLARSCDEPQVHLLSYGHAAATTLPAATPPSLAQLLSGLEDLYSTSTRILIGVQLVPAKAQSTATRARATRFFSEGLDALLGEDVPEFEAVETSRKAVLDVLARNGASALSNADVADLESWYLLGASNDPVVTETENVIRFTGTSQLALAALADVRSSARRRHVPSPSSDTSVTCLSLRGQALVNEIKDASIVVARRATAGSPWLKDLEDAFPECSVQALPLRQLPALSETLPGSAERMSASGVDLDTHILISCGLSDTLRVGDRWGLHMGMSGVDYTEVTWWDPFSSPGQLLAMAGSSGCGKTFLAEYLAIQEITSGRRVVYLSGDGESGRPLVAEYGASPVFEATPGLMSLSHLPEHVSTYSDLVSFLTWVLPEVSASTWRSLLGIPEPDDYSLAVPLKDLASYASDTRVSALLLRARSANPVFSMLGEDSTIPATTSLAVSLPRLLTDIPEKFHAVFEDCLVAAQVLRGGLVIADGVGVGALSSWALEFARSRSLPSTLVVTGRAPLNLAVRPDVCVIGAEPDSAKAGALLNWVGVADTEVRRAWLRDAFPVLLADTVKVSPTFFMRDRTEQNSPLTLAPVPESLLPALTRGRASSY